MLYPACFGDFRLFLPFFGTKCKKIEKAGSQNIGRMRRKRNERIRVI